MEGAVREPLFVDSMKLREQSENVYENKGK